MKSPIKRVGGKMWLVKALLNLMPPHEVYIEPFFGAGHLFFAKQPCQCEVINDLDEDIYNFFKVLQDEDKSRKLIHILDNTPYSRQFFNEAKTADKSHLTDIQKAVNFFVTIRQGFGGQSSGAWGTSIKHNQPQTFLSSVNKLKYVNRRLKKAYIEHDDAVAVLERWLPVCQRNKQTTFVFLDPPYLHETRRGKHRKLYEYESHDKLHIGLLDCVNKYASENILFCITHSPSDLYFEKLKGFQCRTAEHIISVSKKTNQQARDTMKECIWTNF